MYVLDSSALIEVLEGHPKAEKIMELYGNAELVTLDKDFAKIKNFRAIVL